MKTLEEYGNGQHLEHNPKCWKLDNTTIVNEYLDFIKGEESIEKRCGACTKSSLCIALLGDAQKRAERKVERNTYVAKKGHRKWKTYKANRMTSITHESVGT